jgi:hypothetical protein
VYYVFIKIATKNGSTGKISTLNIPLIEAHFFQRINPKWYVFTVAFALDTFNNSGIRSNDPVKDAGNFSMSVLKAW